jgi:hypothetical protein
MVDTKHQAFHAVLEQVEPGLFRATYRGDFNPETQASDVELNGPHILPDMHIGTSAADVKVWVENLAASQGYAEVIWEEPSPEKTDKA